MSEFSERPANPYEAPAADMTAEDNQMQYAGRGPMPTSVIVATIATGVMVLFSAIGTVGQLVQGQLAIGSILSLALGVLILYGLVKGNRLAFQWGRILVLLGAIFYSLGATFAVVGLLALANNPEALDPAALAELEGTDVQAAMYWGIGFMIIALAAMWTIFFSLGTRSARQYFGVVCPNCGSTKVKAGDFFYNSAKCKRCSASW